MVTDSSDAPIRFEVTLPELVGVRIADCPPIGEVFVRLDRGLVVLYGRNGAGKTRVLDGIKDILAGGGSVTGERDLIFSWPAPPRSPEIEFKYPLTLEEVLTLSGAHYRDDGWSSLPGNPWVIFPDRDGLERRYSDGGEIDDFERWVAEFDQLVAALPEMNGDSQPLGPYVADAARWLSCQSEFFIAHPAEHVAMVAMACIEIAQQGRFRLTDRPTGGHGHRGERQRQLRMSAWASNDTPFLHGIWTAMRDEYVRDCDAEPGSASLADITLGLGFGTLGVCMDSIEVLVSGRDRPWWYADAFPEGGQVVSLAAPVELIGEDFSEDLSLFTIERIEGMLPSPEGPSRTARLLVEGNDHYWFHPAVGPIVESITEESNRIFAMLLENAPRLDCRVHSPLDWPHIGCISWISIDPSGAEVPIDQLSRAELRWARFAIRFALSSRESRLPLVILLDEPEAALHRRAERFLVDGLVALTAEYQATVIVATHSPAFLDSSAARLHHVTRDAKGLTSVDEMPPTVRTRIDDLGLEPADLLQHCRTIILVEGQHELTIFDELFQSEFATAGAEVFSIRGLKNLKSAADAQLLLRFTNARLLIVLDNERSERVNDIWRRACTEVDQEGDPLVILNELTAEKWSGEAKFLHEYMSIAVRTSERKRVAFCAMTLPDIGDYLPLPQVAPGAPLDASWQSLRTRQAKEAAGMNFKTWLTREYDADYSDASLRSAVQKLDHLHPDLASLLEAVTDRQGSRAS